MAEQGGRPRSVRSHAAILDATLGLLTEIGYRRLTIEGVAARARVGKSTIYRWWPSKCRLVLEAVGTRITVRPVPLTGDSRTDLRAAVQAAFDGIEHSPLGDVVTGLAVDLLQDADAAADFQAILRTRQEPVARMLDDMARRGDLPSDVDAALLHDVYVGTMFYRALLGRPRTPRVVDQLVDLLLDGRLPRVPAASEPSGPELSATA
jgi:AcrR family transcriptional regulator